MTIPAVGDVAYPSPSEIRDQILADLLNYGLRYGLTFNVLPGSEHYITAQALANRVSIAISNNQIRNNQRDPLVATGTALQDLCRVYGVTPRPASKSAGFLTCINTVAVAVPAGKRATGPNGKIVETVTAVVVAPAGTIEVQSVDTGTDANFAADTIFTWNDATLPALGATATAAAGGIAGGQPADNDDTLRRRLIDRLSFIAAGGNAAAVKGWAEEASASIGAAYVYPCAQGPGSYDVAVTAAGGNRTLSASIVAQAGANVLANMPGGLTAINATTVYPEPIDVIFSTDLALPTTVGGAGGGWRDATPWPAEDTAVTAVGATITVNSTSSPSIGNRIGIWNSDDQEMYEYEILAVAGGIGAWVLTLDQATTNVEIGAYVSAGAVNLKAYAATALDQFNALGPGEKTDDTDLLPRASRQLPPDVADPYKVTSVQIGGILAAHDEILDLTYSNVYASGTLTPLTEPSIPPTTADPPRILVLQWLAFRKAT